MKKFIFSIIMMFAIISSYAQHTTVEGSRFFDNTSIGIYGGGMGYVTATDFLKSTKPVFGIDVRKEFTPVWGAELFFDNSTSKLYPDNGSRWGKLGMFNLGGNVRLNLNNAIHKYKGRPDLVEVVPFAGLGWQHQYETTPETTVRNYLAANLGATVDFNMGKQRAWQINVRPMISYALAGRNLPVQFNINRAYVSLQVGVTYKFGYRNSTKARTHNFTKAYTVAEYYDLQKRYDDLQKQTPKVVEKTVEVVKEVPVEKVIEVTKTVKTFPSPHFVKGLAIVDATSVAALDELANEMKTNDDTYTVTGYASMEGDETYNKNLSLNRANAIVRCLVDRGVDKSRFNVVAGGPTEKFGSTYEANRVVVVEK